MTTARPTRGNGQAPQWRLLGRAAVLAFLTGVATGCYSYLPLPASPATGTEVKLDISDQGRVALGESLGPSVRFIEGRLQAASDTGYVMNVSSVGYVNGTENKWSGERVVVRPAYVSAAKERRLSKGKTWFGIAVGVGAALAYILTRSIFASGSPDPEPPPVTNPNNS